MTTATSNSDLKQQTIDAVDGHVQLTKDSNSNSGSSLAIKLRRSDERGHADHGWLNTYHTFNFANYYEDGFDSFHGLRVLNEDRVKPGRGFGTHPHRMYEIWSYVVSGGLLHQDSMGNKEVISRGDVQFTSAGTGIAHSEMNASQKDMVHFIQIWATPNQHGLKPSYKTMHFSDKDKEGKLCLIIHGDDERKDTIHVHQKLSMYASLLKDGERVQLPVRAGRAYFVHVVDDVEGRMVGSARRTGVTVNGTLLRSGDGAFLTAVEGKSPLEGEVITLVGHVEKNKEGGGEGGEANDNNNNKRAEILVFDVAELPDS